MWSLSEPGAVGGLTVIAVGSRLSRDDEVALLLVEALARAPLPEGVETRLWEDADALSVTQALLDTERAVVLVDCADMGASPGAWRLFRDDEVRLRGAADSVSTHGFGLADALALARTLGFGEPVWVFGVQPGDLRPGHGLSPAVEARFGETLKALGAAIGKIGDEL
jgi:hydrogenase maturation protease